MPKSQKLRSGLKAPDSPDDEPAAEAGPRLDLDAVVVAMRQTEQSVLIKINSSVKLHKQNKTIW